jgi:hypothetical protein
MPDLSDQELLDALGVEAEPGKQVTRSPREERIIAGFEEIQRFVEAHGCEPTHGDDKDIFERLYAVRLERLRTLAESEELLKPLDHQGLLTGVETATAPEKLEVLDDAELLAQLGIENQGDDITELKHVRSRKEIIAADEVATRTRCEEFEKFEPIFVSVKTDLEAGLRQTTLFKDDASVEAENLFILSGQIVYVAKKGEDFYSEAQSRTDARIRVIYNNGTESNLLMTSLQRSLQKDVSGRRITNPSAGPLFSGESNEGDIASGVIYVLRSKSDHPVVTVNRNIIHKIGVTSGDVKKRISGASREPTFLMADVEVVATYELFNINRSKLENLLHRVFSTAQLDIEIKDRFGNPSRPHEWFLVPIAVIDDAIEKIKSGSLNEFEYNISTASLERRKI